MDRSEKAIVTVLCMVYNEDMILLQDRVKEDWKGLTFPGGHVEKGEPFTKSVIREIYEETGLIIKNPELCGVKQFQTDNEERYIVFLYKTNQFEGELKSSDEGEMVWINRDSLHNYKLVDDFDKLFEVFDSNEYNEFYYDRCDGDWKVCLF